MLPLKTVQWLFHRDGQRVIDFRHAWDAACKRAGVGKRLPHDFRRTAIRNMERVPIARSRAMELVGHKTQAIYERYAIADVAALEEAAVKLAALHDRDAAKAANVYQGIVTRDNKAKRR